MIDHISLAVLRAVAAPLIVRVPLVVAALVNVIGPVDLIDAVDDQGPRPPPKKTRCSFRAPRFIKRFPSFGELWGRRLRCRSSFRQRAEQLELDPAILGADRI